MLTRKCTVRADEERVFLLDVNNLNTERVAVSVTLYTRILEIPGSIHSRVMTTLMEIFRGFSVEAGESRDRVSIRSRSLPYPFLLIIQPVTRRRGVWGTDNVEKWIMWKNNLELFRNIIMPVFSWHHHMFKSLSLTHTHTHTHGNRISMLLDIEQTERKP